jgi:hypothetical protein
MKLVVYEINNSSADRNDEQRSYPLRPALAMFHQGHGLKSTAGAMGVSVTTLRERLKETGEWPRPKGVRKAP